jgi:uncharacterized metal-binding protein
MDTSSSHCSKPKYKLVFSCSGAADVGAISDRAARQLKDEKAASMCCIAAIGAEIPEILETTSNAAAILAIDGCDKNCARIILEKAGFTDFQHMQLEELGMKKGESPVTEERVEQAVVEARKRLSA